MLTYNIVLPSGRSDPVRPVFQRLVHMQPSAVFFLCSDTDPEYSDGANLLSDPDLESCTPHSDPPVLWRYIPDDSRPHKDKEPESPADRRQ